MAQISLSKLILLRLIDLCPQITSSELFSRFQRIPVEIRAACTVKAQSQYMDLNSLKHAKYVMVTDRQITLTNKGHGVINAFLNLLPYFEPQPMFSANHTSPKRLSPIQTHSIAINRPPLQTPPASLEPTLSTDQSDLPDTPLCDKLTEIWDWVAESKRRMLIVRCLPYHGKDPKKDQIELICIKILYGDLENVPSNVRSQLDHCINETFSALQQSQD